MVQPGEREIPSSQTPAPNSEIGVLTESYSPEFLKFIPAVGKNINVFYLLDMSRTPDESYGVTARPLAPIIDGRFTDGANWYFFSPNKLTGSIKVGTQHYYANCEEVERDVYAPILTEKGKNLGVPAAGLMAEFALRRGIVLDRIFLENTFSSYHPGNQVIEQRLEFLKEMSESEEEYREDNYRQFDDHRYYPRLAAASGLSRLGWAETSEERNDKGLRTAYSYKINAEGRIALTELFAILDIIQSSDAEGLARGQEYAMQISGDTDRLHQLLVLVSESRDKFGL